MTIPRAPDRYDRPDQDRLRATLETRIAALEARVNAAVLTPASKANGAGLRLPHGTAPSSPIDGDIWTTTAGLFVRVNGVTVGPLT